MDKLGNNVLIYNFSKDEIEFMKNNMPSKNYNIISSDDDIMYFVLTNYSLGIYNATTKAAEDISKIYNILEEQIPFSQTIVIVGNADLPKSLKGKIKIYKNFEELKMEYKHLVLNAGKKAKKDYDHSRHLSNLLVILTKILNNPGITTEELCYYCSDLSPRSIKRYIDTLNIAGEYILKNKTTKGWKLGCDGESILISDALLRKKEYSLYNTCDCCKEYKNACKVEEDWTSEYKSDFENDKLREFDEDINNINLIKHPSKTILDVLDRKPNDENLISDWLAFLFDTRANGMKLNFTLDALFNTIGFRYSGIMMEKIIDIQRELSIRLEKEVEKENDVNYEDRRIDLLIECSEFVIVIENKIDSWENNKQTDAYYNYIEKCEKYKDKNKIYIYLKPDNNSSHPSCEFFEEVTYSELLKEFSKIESSAYKNKEMYKFHYLIEFLRVGANFMSVYDIDENVEFYIKNYNKWEDIKSEYLKRNEVLKKDIVNSVKNNLGKLFEVKEAQTYIQFYKPDWNKYGIHFEILSYDKFEFLGRDTVELYLDLHLENTAGINIEIEKYSEKMLCKFNSQDDCKYSISKIVEKIDEYNKRYTSRIDEIVKD